MSAGERADAIPEAAKLLAFIRENKSWFCGGRMVEPYESQAVEKLAAFLRAAHPEAGSEEAERDDAEAQQEAIEDEMFVVRDEHPNWNWDQDRSRILAEAKRRVLARAALPEAERAPERWAGQEEQWDQGSSGAGDVDRAPGEVEMVARALKERFAPDDVGYGRMPVTAHATDIAEWFLSLDAARGRSREDISEHDGLPGYWVCEQCGQPLGDDGRCDSGLHVGPGDDANGMAVHTTDLVAELRRSREDTVTLADVEAFLRGCNPSTGTTGERLADAFLARFGAARAEDEDVAREGVPDGTYGGARPGNDAGTVQP